MTTKVLTTNYEVRTEQFSGPLDLLLSLIEKNELPITSVSLATVTEQYLRHLDAMDVSGEDLAGFLLVAARLLELKSRELLPDLASTEEDTTPLEAQVRLFKLFMQMAPVISERFYQIPQMAVRQKPQLPVSARQTFPRGLTSFALADAFARLLKYLQPFFSLERRAMERVQSVNERIEELRAVLVGQARVAWRELASRSKSKVDLVVSFLALLELVKQRAVRTVQKGTFSDLFIERV